MVAVANKGVDAPQNGKLGPRKQPQKQPWRFWRQLLKAIHGLRDRYEPAKHYMRGPGPASLQRARRTVGHDE